VRHQRAGDVLRDYTSLLKLRIVPLLVLTGVAATLVASRRVPPAGTVLAVALGGALAAAGASAINCWFDSDIDAAMARTRHRPIPAGRIPAWRALAVGIAMNTLAFVILTILANVVAALLALTGTAIYVLVYTMWLKRSTPQNIVIGGAAGAMPPLVGWAAATGRLDWTAVSLFLVILFWTPPHFWALAQMIRRDYEKARVPMLPVVLGEGPTRRRSLLYAGLTLVASLLPVLTHAEGPVYLVGAALLGIGLMTVCWLDLTRRGWTARVFGYSLVYLAALFTLLTSVAFGI
jgi:protoheme IX farnesyltransferase